MFRKSTVPLLAAFTLTFVVCGCSSSVRPAASPATGKSATSFTTPPTGVVAAVSVVDGTTLVEVTVTTSTPVEAGTLWRVSPPNQPAALKAVLQTLAAQPGPGRIMSRVIGQTDRQVPVLAGDRALVVDDPTALAGGAEQAVADAAAGRAASDRQQTISVEALRRQFSSDLERVQATQKAAVAQIQAEADRRVATAAVERDAAVSRVRDETAATIARERASLAERIAAGAALERDAASARIAALTAENARLSGQVAALLAGQREVQARIDRSLATQRDLDQRTQVRLNAEIAARAALAAQVVELEARLAGTLSASARSLAGWVTVNHSGPPATDRSSALGDEPVLDRLGRLAAELATTRAALVAAIAERDRVTSEANRLSVELDAARGQVAALEQRLAGATATADRIPELEHRQAEAERQAVLAERRAAAAQIARLEAERSLFELAGVVLRTADAAGWKRIQATIPARLAGRLEGADPGESPVPPIPTSRQPAAGPGQEATKPPDRGPPQAEPGHQPGTSRAVPNSPDGGRPAPAAPAQSEQPHAGQPVPPAATERHAPAPSLETAPPAELVLPPVNRPEPEPALPPTSLPSAGPSLPVTVPAAELALPPVIPTQPAPPVLPPAKPAPVEPASDRPPHQRSAVSEGPTS